MVLAFLAALTIPSTGIFHLPNGTTEISSELKIPPGAHDLTIAGGDRTVLHATAGFQGRALIVCSGCRKIKFYNFSIDGNRAALAKPQPIAPSDKSFAEFYTDNGILIEDAAAIEMDRVSFANIANFAVLVARAHSVTLDRLRVENSGSLNALHRNNTTGGILLEEGTELFEVADSVFENIRGNAVWTHSRYESPRNHDGKIRNNQFSEIGRDAIQIGHALDIEVSGNRGRRIGFPAEVVDVENGGTPCAIDTAGNVEKSTYQHNSFEEINGKCIDLDGFHDGDVTFNTCVNKGRAADYPSGHFGIVVNDWNPDMKSENITIADNTIDGAKFGGIFLIGSKHRVLRNKLLNLNLAHCNENAAVFGCVAIQGEPDVLQAGIYLGRVAAEWAQKRGDASRDHIIRDNVIKGYKMSSRCILAAPGVKLSESTIERNTCTDE